MGGHAGGCIASALAVNAARDWLTMEKIQGLQLEVVEEMLSAVNQAVWDYSRENPDLTGMGTTFTGMLVKDSVALVGHIGDTRLYRFRKNELKQLSADHTLVAEQVKMGKLTPQEAREHSARHILSRVVGVRQFISIDTMRLELVPGDLYMICSDGVYGMIGDDKIKEILSMGNLDAAARAIIQASNEAGGEDNSTVVLVKFNEVPVIFPGKFSWTRLKSAFWGKVRSSCSNR